MINLALGPLSVPQLICVDDIVCDAIALMRKPYPSNNDIARALAQQVITDMLFVPASLDVKDGCDNSDNAN
jgi:hypothetical protein